jgi:hypothetical protein
MKRPEESNLENDGSGNGFSFSYEPIKKLSVQKGTNRQGDVRYCTISPGTPYVMSVHVVSRHFMSLSDTCPNASQIFKSVLIGSGTPH